MAIAKKDILSKNIGRSPLWKYVKRARMWCKTWWDADGKQHNDFFTNEARLVDISK